MISYVLICYYSERNNYIYVLLKSIADPQGAIMDPRVAWLMPEQMGPAAEIWQRMNEVCKTGVTKKQFIFLFNLACFLM